MGLELVISRNASQLVSFGLALIVFAAVSGNTYLWDGQGAAIWNSASWIGGIGALILLFPVIVTRKLPKTLDARVFALFLIPLFFTDWLCRQYNLLQGPPIRGEILLFAFFTGLMFRARVRFTPYLRGITVFLLLVVLAGSFFYASHGRIIFSDDHPVFQMRLQYLKDNFPFIPFFSPLWNGGIDARDFFATGSLNFFFVFSPLIYAFPLQQSYNFLVALLLFLFFPGCMYGAARIARLRHPAPYIAAILAVTVSLFWYRWALKYGTMGFITSVSLLPINVAILGIVLSPKRELSPGLAVLSVFSVTFSLFWSLSGFAFIPGILLALLLFRRVLHKKFSVLIVIALLAINIPWIGMFLKVSNVFNFVQAESLTTARHIPTPEAKPLEGEQKLFRHKKGGFDLAKSIKKFQENARAANPLILFLLIPGLFMLRPGTRLAFGATCFWLGSVGAVLIPVKPQLELDRMLLIMFVLSCIPVAECIRRLYLTQRLRPSLLSTVAAVTVGGYFFAAPFSVAGVLGNRSVEQYYFANDEVQMLANAIERFGGSGRVLFSGFVLHELSQGHLAPLVFQTSKQLMASSHVHDKWQYRQIIPAEYMEKKREGIIEYLDLYNVTAVVAHEKPWRDFFLKHPGMFEPVWRGPTFEIFQRKGITPSYFLEGEGSILSIEGNKVVFSLQSNDAVLKFNYFPFLEVQGCVLSKEDISESVHLVRLSGCPTDIPLTLHSVDPLTRLFFR
ncbi:MAG: hypothetical protein KDD70_09550 [Bdellovibrionales bacterium]|nr:hypothetical protein [Bdellovibrionales bacterium]